MDADLITLGILQKNRQMVLDLYLKLETRMKKEGSIWINLYNALFVISSRYADLKHLESPVFEVLDELESSIVDGLRQESLNYYLDNKWIDDREKDELIKFRQHLDSINTEQWNKYDFDSSEDWNLARSWAKSLMVRLGIKNNGWNSTGEIIMED
ncbi:hypothetical protein [Roseivirga pacifica]|uniref:hypothetical protein n=1 Tax=Roseivirga pacifica TaxID=1267423 RepID=UPI003BAC27EC